MEIRHLRYFVAVAEELNFGRAAGRLHIAASPLSRRIRDLEHELGTGLFVRTHHRVALTAAGEALLPVARDVVRRFDAVPAAVRDPGPAALRRARVGIAPDVSPALRRAFLDAVARDHPDLDVRFRPGSTGPLLQALAAGEVDLALVHGPVDEPGVTAFRLASAAAGVAVAAGSGFDDHDSVALAELRDLAYVSIRRDAAPLLYGRTRDLLRRHGVARHIELDGHNLAELAHLVTTGRAFTLVGLGTGTTHKVFAGEPVVVLPVRDAVLRIGTAAAWCTARDAACDVVGALAGVVRGPLAASLAGDGTGPG